MGGHGPSHGVKSAGLDHYATCKTHGGRPAATGGIYLCGCPLRRKFDHNRGLDLPDIVCACGKCGETFKRVIGQGSRKYAQGCPFYALTTAAKNRAYEVRAAARRKQESPKQHTVGGLCPVGAPVKRAKMCQGCCNLPHNRPPGGCGQGMTFNEKGHMVTCGLPAEYPPPAERDWIEHIKASAYSDDKRHNESWTAQAKTKLGAA